MKRPPYALVLAAGLLCALPVRADDAASKPTPSRHQLMKECMAKQKASDGGMPKEDMKRNCRDVTETERENAKVEKSTEEKAPETSGESPKK